MNAIRENQKFKARSILETRGPLAGNQIWEILVSDRLTHLFYWGSIITCATHRYLKLNLLSPPKSPSQNNHKCSLTPGFKPFTVL